MHPKRAEWEPLGPQMGAPWKPRRDEVESKSGPKGPATETPQLFYKTNSVAMSRVSQEASKNVLSTTKRPRRNRKGETEHRSRGERAKGQPKWPQGCQKGPQGRMMEPMAPIDPPVSGPWRPVGGRGGRLKK